MASTRYRRDASDDALVAGLRARAAGALEAVYGRHSRTCYAVAFRLLGDPVAARNLLREVFVELWQQADTVEVTPDGGLGAWLVSRTHQRAVEALRSGAAGAARRPAADVLADLAAVTSHADDAAGRRERVRAALTVLPPGQRESLALAYFGGYTQREVAGLTGTSLESVQQACEQAVHALRAAALPPVTLPEWAP